MIKQFYFDLYIEAKQVLPLRARVDLVVIAMKEYSTEL